MNDSPREAAVSRDTSGIIVRAVSEYRADQSDLESTGDEKYVFAYHIEIENQGERSVQLLSRHWWITDARQTVREVTGGGVVGQRPVIEPVFQPGKEGVFLKASKREQELALGQLAARIRCGQKRIPGVHAQPAIDPGTRFAESLACRHLRTPALLL